MDQLEIKDAESGVRNEPGTFFGGQGVVASVANVVKFTDSEILAGPNDKLKNSDSETSGTTSVKKAGSKIPTRQIILPRKFKSDRSLVCRFFQDGSGLRICRNFHCVLITCDWAMISSIKVESNADSLETAFFKIHRIHHQNP